MQLSDHQLQDLFDVGPRAPAPSFAGPCGFGFRDRRRVGGRLQGQTPADRRAPLRLAAYQAGLQRKTRPTLYPRSDMRTVHWLFIVSVALFISGIGFIIASARTRTPQPEASASVTGPADGAGREREADHGRHRDAVGGDCLGFRQHHRRRQGRPGERAEDRRGMGRRSAPAPRRSSSPPTCCSWATAPSIRATG